MRARTLLSANRIERRDSGPHEIGAPWREALTTQAASRKFLAGWGDVDMNGHMRGTAYLNKAIDARVSILAEMGFPQEEFAPP